MSYNIDSIETLKSTLEITAKDLRAIYRKYGDDNFPEDCFLQELDAHEEDATWEIENLIWEGTWSGNSTDTLHDILKNFMTGEGEFILTWEGGDSITGLRVIEKDGVRTVTEPKVMRSLAKD